MENPSKITVRSLRPGKDAIENGYLVLSEPIDEQAPADRESRIAPPIYIMLKLAGAIHFVIIEVNVNR